MLSFIFNSKISEGKKLHEFTQEQIKNEPMFWRADREFALKHGGLITSAFIDALSDDWKTSDIIIDSRAHMLFPGYVPCIPGWHHDAVPREREDGQPNYINPSYHSEHVMALVNGVVAPTEFALGHAEFPEVPIGQKYYKVWSPMVSDKIKNQELTKYTVPDNTLIYFNWQSWHRGVPAVMRGWRFFIRATRNTAQKARNEIRHQVQVFSSNPEEGW